eukprot:TRINITY_DN11174_c0_g1_i3.p1 TRINITY_DN11174_c0_g1~~TRINITY_DN11174_c0_g1_i3.p1  ORF type:complete len:621 (+),score=216.29 TRINITY_DN11174_c0_g1_i3:163-1863(+)
MASDASSIAASASAAVSDQTSLASIQHPFSMHGRVVIKKLLDAPKGFVGQEVTIGGWVKTGRVQGKGAFVFLEVNDGSTPTNLQCLVSSEVHDINALSATGTCVVLKGKVVDTPEDSKEAVEIKATEVIFVGPSDASSYPIAKTKLSLEYLRTMMHFRIRSNTIAAVTRIRNCLAGATHRFFQENGFMYVNTPLITSSDCEGAGEMFQVTTMLSTAEELHKTPMPSEEDIARAEGAVQEMVDKVAAMKEAGEKAKKIKKANKDVESRRARVKELKLRLASEGGLPRTLDGEIDYSKDFFAKPAFLSVSGQLEAEVYACAMTSVYTFGPTFRAENSNTTRHLAEFWMIEPEIAFCDIHGDMACAEAYVQYCCKAILQECRADMEFIAKHFDKTALERVELVSKTPFKRLPYTEAIDILLKHVEEGKKKFEVAVEWGMDLGSEHERYLAEEVFKGPIIVYDYPKDIKAFYMRLNDDGKTVAAMDILVPKVGELVGGSQREERLDVLEKRLAEMDLDQEAYSWYLDLRRYGTVPHSGFGLGFERLVLFTTGMENIRDVIPFPRYPGHIL